MTFSIIAFNHADRTFALAVASCHLAIGSTTPHLQDGVAAVATQAKTNPSLGDFCIEKIQSNKYDKNLLNDLLVVDQGREFRQIHLVDRHGSSFAWTGKHCQEWSGHISGKSYSIAGHNLAGSNVLKAMESSFLLHSEGGNIIYGVLMALQAAQDRGGDIRSKSATSAALRVSGKSINSSMNISVDSHEEAINELIRSYHSILNDTSLIHNSNVINISSNLLDKKVAA